MKTAKTIGGIALAALTALFVGPALYALPATLSLPRGRRPGIQALTLAEAARRLQATGKRGEALVEAARALVADRMQYCRRNSFDSRAEAFQRGYGYCVQQAYALADLLGWLGVEARVVRAFNSLSKVLNHTRPVRLLTMWGEAAVNAHRYYPTGKDF